MYLCACISLCAFTAVCLKTPTCAHQKCARVFCARVYLLCTAPLVSQTLYCITKQIAANQIRALSSTQTRGDEWKKSLCVFGGDGGGGSEVASRDPAWGWKDAHMHSHPHTSMDGCSFRNPTHFFAFQRVSLSLHFF